MLDAARRPARGRTRARARPISAFNQAETIARWHHAGLCGVLEAQQRRDLAVCHLEQLVDDLLRVEPAEDLAQVVAR